MSESVCIAYYSRTGNTQTVARKIANRFRATEVIRIRPQTERTYVNWLVRSFVPGSRVSIDPIQTQLGEYDAVFLGTPKWTVSCPPFSEFLYQVDLDGLPTGLFMTYGGFDEERYLRALVADLEERGADVRATLRVQRNCVDSAGCDDGVDRFCQSVTSNVDG